MDIVATLLTLAGGTISATAGVLVGGWVTRRGQDRQWFRDKQLVAYAALFDHAARFTMVLRRAHIDHTGWDYDWGAWSSALVAASVLAPPEVAAEISNFGDAVDTFLGHVGGDTITSSLTATGFESCRVPVAAAQLRLVNAVRLSLSKQHGEISEAIGG